MIEVEWRLVGGEAVSVPARIGKPLDVVALKHTDLEGVRAEARELAAVAAGLYRRAAPVPDCPLCGAGAAEATAAATVFAVDYVRCPRCEHAFVGRRPEPEVLEERFEASEQLAATYVDPRSLEVRLAQVVRPKLEWLLDVYGRRCGGAPRSLLDVGAGGGHFVAAALGKGLEATGYEVSAPARAFAREAFGVELDGGDFLAGRRRADVVSFWGLLEYTPEPRRFLEQARDVVEPAGLFVVEVPRFDCLGTAVQRTYPETVARHLDPTSHLNVFSDGGLASALVECGFRPVEAWYFGMDAYELAVQTSLRTEGALFAELAAALLPLQPALDAALFCDGLVVAAVPV